MPDRRNAFRVAVALLDTSTSHLRTGGFHLRTGIFGTVPSRGRRFCPSPVRVPHVRRIDTRGDAIPITGRDGLQVVAHFRIAGLSGSPGTNSGMRQPMMKAMLVEEHGQPLRLADVPIPEPADGEVRIRIEAVGINFADLLMVAGTYQEKPPLPFSPGMEFCGRIERVNDPGSELRIGQRVVSYAGHGGMAGFRCVPTSHCITVSDEMPAETAAGFLIAYGTSHVALEHRARIRPGERLLVLGAAGGTGLSAVEIGKVMGAEVIAAARGPDRLKAALRAGADHAIDTEREDIRETVKGLGGADVVFDPVGGEQFRAAMRSANPEARLLPIGFASGEVPQIPANILLVKNLTVIGFYWGGYRRFRPSVIADSARTLLSWHREHRLNPTISHVLPLERANDALDLLRRRKSVGKVVVKVASDG